jgi:hypothetical protein
MVETDVQDPYAAEFVDIDSIRPANFFKPGTGERSDPWYPAQMSGILVSSRFENPLRIVVGIVSWTPKMRQLAKVEPCP